MTNSILVAEKKVYMRVKLPRFSALKNLGKCGHPTHRYSFCDSGANQKAILHISSLSTRAHIQSKLREFEFAPEFFLQSFSTDFYQPTDSAAHFLPWCTKQEASSKNDYISSDWKMLRHQQQHIIYEDVSILCFYQSSTASNLPPPTYLTTKIYILSFRQIL